MQKAGPFLGDYDTLFSPSESEHELARVCCTPPKRNQPTRFFPGRTYVICHDDLSESRLMCVDTGLEKRSAIKVAISRYSLGFVTLGSRQISQPFRKVRRLTSASLMISAARLKLGANTAILSMSMMTSLMIWSIASRCGTRVKIILNSDGDIVAPITRRVCETIDSAPCHR